MMDNHFDDKAMLISRTEKELYELSRSFQEEKLKSLIDKL